MNAELKEKWVKALRSGRYEQTGGVLSDSFPSGEENCCLGVLCRVARIQAADWRDYTLLSDVPVDGKRLHLALGLTKKQEGKLANLNDGGKPFAEIADYIEANL